MFDPNMPRWIHASIATELKSVGTTLNIPTLVEGVELRDSSFNQAPHKAEIRYNGPFISVWAAGSDVYTVRLNVLITSHMDSENAYFLDTMLGAFAERMYESFAILKCGDGDDFIGCMSVIPEKASSVKVFRFGQVNDNDLVQQGAVTAQYRMDFNNTGP